MRNTRYLAFIFLLFTKNKYIHINRDNQTFVNNVSYQNTIPDSLLSQHEMKKAREPIAEKRHLKLLFIWRYECFGAFD